MGTIKLGAKYAVDEYLKINSSQKVVIITDRPSARFTKAIIKEAKKRTGDIHTFVMEDYCTGRRRKFPREIMDNFEDPRKKVVSFYLATDDYSKSYWNKFEVLRMSDPVADLMDEKDLQHVKHVVMDGICKKIMQQGMCVPLEYLKKYTDLIYRRINSSKKIEITSPAGTELEMIINKDKVPWHKDDHVSYGVWENLPLGEVYTSPINCNGRLVIDWVIGAGYEFEYSPGFLRRYPIIMEIKDGCVEEILCRRPTSLVSELADSILRTDDNSSCIGEMGFGTNFGVPKLIGNSLQDEKFPGVHIGIGDSEPYCGKEWLSNTHIDVMMLEPSVYVDGKPLIVDGRYKFNGGNGRKHPKPL